MKNVVDASDAEVCYYKDLAERFKRKIKIRKG
jgi:hypothetical protein